MSEDRLVRLENLRRFIADPSRQWGAKELSQRLPGRYSYWRDMLDGKKSFGEKVARQTEDKLGLPRLWLDRDDAPMPAPTPAVEGVAESLARLPADMAALLPQDAEVFGAEIVQLCDRIHERAEQVRKHATTLQPVKPELPEDIEDLKRELDALGPAERKIAYARAMNIISSPPLRPERIRRNRHHAPAPSAAAAPKSKPKVRR